MKTKQSKGKKIVKVPEPKEEPVISLYDRAMREKEKGHFGEGHPRTVAREAYQMWCMIPGTFLGMPDTLSEKMGLLEDEDHKFLLTIKTQTRFSEVFGVHPAHLIRWRNEFLKDNKDGLEMKRYFKKFTKNILSALYRTALAEGDASRIKLWLQYAEDWRETLGMEHSGSITDGLSDEERESLDKLRIKNTYAK